MIELIIIWLLYVFVISQLLPVLLELLAYLIGFLMLCLWTAFKSILKGVWIGLCFLFRWTIIKPMIALFRGLWTAMLLAWFLVVEVVMGPQADEPDHEERPYEEAEHDDAEDVASAYDAACRLLGFDPQGSQDELKRVYRTMIRRAHPDAGGCAAQAAAVNEARDLIKECRGWV